MRTYWLARSLMKRKSTRSSLGAPDQASGNATSWYRTPGSRSPQVKGPVPIGLLRTNSLIVSASTPPLASTKALLMIEPVGVCTSRLRKNGQALISSTVTSSGPVAAMRSGLVQSRSSCAGAKLRVSTRCRLNATSSAVRMSPLWNGTPSRIWNTKVRPSSETVHDSASHGM
jgi:hypothetical protein